MLMFVHEFSFKKSGGEKPLDTTISIFFLSLSPQKFCARQQEGKRRKK
jgi:hypothetical protein